MATYCYFASSIFAPATRAAGPILFNCLTLSLSLLQRFREHFYSYLRSIVFTGALFTFRLHPRLHFHFYYLLLSRQHCIHSSALSSPFRPNGSSGSGGRRDGSHRSHLKLCSLIHQAGPWKRKSAYLPSVFVQVKVSAESAVETPCELQLGPPSLSS